MMDDLVLTAIQRIRQLHSQWHFGPDGIICAHRSHAGQTCTVQVAWPCPTLIAIEGLPE